jgi:hypothetical protein
MMGAADNMATNSAPEIAGKALIVPSVRFATDKLRQDQDVFGSRIYSRSRNEFSDAAKVLLGILSSDA